MVVSCYPALQHLHLDWYNLTQDLIICHTEQAWLQAQLTIPRRPRECLFTAQERKHLLKAQKKWFQFPSWWQARSKSYKATQILLGYWMLSRSPYHIQLDPSITPNQTPCRPIPVHLKEVFKHDIDKMLKPVHEAKLWINSLCLLRGITQLVTWSLESAWTPPIWTKW